MENLTLTYAEVQQEVENINALANTVKNDADNLMQVARKCINSGIVTEWGQDLLAKLQNFNNAQMAAGIEEIKKEAKKLEEISRATATYSQGQ